MIFILGLPARFVTDGSNNVSKDYVNVLFLDDLIYVTTGPTQ